MRIEGPNNLPAAGLSDLDGGALRRPPTIAGAPSGAADTVSAAPAQQHYVAQAKACPDVDQAAVAAAKKAIETGELDTPEAIERAAERMLTLGL